VVWVVWLVDIRYWVRFLMALVQWCSRLVFLGLLGSPRFGELQ
jgi:hypothetical protein